MTTKSSFGVLIGIPFVLLLDGHLSVSKYDAVSAANGVFFSGILRKSVSGAVYAPAFSVRQTTPRRGTSCLNTMTELEPAVILDRVEAGFQYAKHGTKSERLLSQPRRLASARELGLEQPFDCEESGGSRKGGSGAF
jgi:hypothetical protein